MNCEQSSNSRGFDEPLSITASTCSFLFLFTSALPQLSSVLSEEQGTLFWPFLSILFFALL